MKRHKKCKGLLWGFLCAVWGFVCLFPIWVLFSGTFSNDSDNLTQGISHLLQQRRQKDYGGHQHH